MSIWKVIHLKLRVRAVNMLMGLFSGVQTPGVYCRTETERNSYTSGGRSTQIKYKYKHHSFKILHYKPQYIRLSCVSEQLNNKPCLKG